MLEGWKLYHNPYLEKNKDFSNSDLQENKDSNTDLQKYEDIEGNANRDLWKSTAIEYCKKVGENIEEVKKISNNCLCFSQI